MGLDQIYDKVCVKVSCVNISGSGVLVQSESADCTYVLTAKHCLIGKKSSPQSFTKDDIKISRIESYSNSRYDFYVKDYLLHPDDNVDLAVIIIEKFRDFNTPEISLAEYKNMVTLCGYPAELKDYTANPKEKLYGSITNTSGRIEFKINSLHTFEKDDKSYLEAFSGSGLFVEVEQNKLALIGIFIEVKQKEVAYGSLISESIAKVNEVLESKGFPLLPEPKKLFNHYVDAEYSAKSVVFSTPNNTPSLAYQGSAVEIHKDLGEVYEIQLDRLVRQRRIGDRTGATNELNNVLIKANKLPSNVAAQFYMKAALWEMEDKPSSKHIEEYYIKAVSLDPSIDVRIYQANKFCIDKNYEAALEVLQPLDGETVLITALNIYLKLERGSEAEQLLFMSKVKPTPIIHQGLARCFLQAGMYTRATREIEKAMKQDEQMPYHYLIAGYISYWQGIPDDLQYNRSRFFPPLWADVFLPTTEQMQHLEKAIEYFTEAKTWANKQGAIELAKECQVATFLTRALLPKYQGEADQEALFILREDPCNLFAFSYAVFNGVSLNDIEHIEPIRQAIQNGVASVQLISSLIIYFLNNNNTEQALVLLEDHKFEFLHQDMLKEWTSHMIHYHMAVGNTGSAESLLMHSTDINDKDKTIMQLYMLTQNEDESDAIHTAEKIVSLRGTRIDYQHLCRALYRNKSWEKLISATREWMALYPDATVVGLMAEAQFQLNAYNDCLETFDKYRYLFPEGELDSHSKRMRIQALQNVGRLESAVKEANELWIQSPSENLLMTRAFLYQSLGNIIQVITVLKEGIGEGFDSQDVYVFLTNILTPYYPDEAYRYAREAIKKYKNDALYLHAISIGHATNHDDEAGELLREFHSEFPDSTLLKLVSISDVLEMRDEYQQGSKANRELFASGKLPIHLLIESEKAAFGAWYYDCWFSNKELDQPIKYAFPLVFGGRGYESLKNYQKDCIVMEYSACLTAYALELFPILRRAFTKILVSPNLLNCIQADLGKMRSHQPSVYHNRQRLKRKLERLRGVEIEFTDDLEIDEDIVWQDAREWDAAKKHNAFIVTDHFATEVLQDGRQIPAELKKMQVTTVEVLQTLIGIGDIPEDALKNTQYESLSARQDVVEELMEGSIPLLVDEVLLSSLMDNEWLEIAADHFTLLIPTELKYNLETQQEDVERREESIRWLEGLLNTLRDLYDEGVVEFTQATSHDSDRNLIRTQLLDILAQQQDNEVAIWVDDRYFNSFASFNNNFPTVSVTDVLNFLHSLNLLSIPMYIGKLNKLIHSQVQFIVPPASYVLYLLRKMKVDDNGDFRESQHLKSLRYEIAAALSTNSVIGKQGLRENQLPEVLLYLWQLNSVFRSVLSEIWQDNERSESWCIAASNWLLKYAYELPYDQSVSDNEDMLVQQTAFFQSILVYHALSMSEIKDKTFPNQRRYLNWLFPVLRQEWHSMPGSYELFLDRFVSMIQDTSNDDLMKLDSEVQVEFYEDIYLMRIQSLVLDLPQDILGDLLRTMDDKWREKLGIRYEQTIQFQDFELGIPNSVWKEWVARAIDRGTGVKGEECHAGNQFEVIWHPEQGIASQAVEVGRTDESGVSLGRVYSLEPFAQLEYGDVTQRMNWIGEARQYINISDEEMTQYRSSTDFDLELKNRLMLSPKYFFDCAKVLIESAYQSLPKEEVLFPQNPELFQNWLPLNEGLEDVDAEQWLNICKTMLCKSDLQEVMSIINVLPVGGECSFYRLMINLIDQGEINESDVRTWCIREIGKTINPIQKQQLLRFLLQSPDSFSDNTDQLNLIRAAFTDLLEVEECEQNRVRLDKYKLYFGLMRYAESIMSLSNSYSNYSKLHHILWAYLYADRMLDVIENAKLPVPISVYTKAIEDYAESKLSQVILRDIYSLPLEVSHPRAASIWRVVFGGGIEVLLTNVIPNDIRELLSPRLQQMLFLSLVSKLPVQGVEEVYCSFSNCTDSLASGFNQNNAERLSQLVNSWENGIDKSVFDLGIVTSMKLQKVAGEDQSSLKNALGFLSVLARQPLPSEAVPAAKELLIKHRITPDLRGQDFHQQGVVLSNLIKALPTDEKQHFTELYRDDIIQVLLKHEGEWEIAVQILATLAMLEDKNAACKTFLDLLETVVYQARNLLKHPYTKQLIDNLVQQMPVVCRGRLLNLRKEIP